MKRRLIPAAALLPAGLVMVLLPEHMQMTGVVLLLLGAAAALWAALYDRSGARIRMWLRILMILASVGVIGLMTAMNLISFGGQADWENAEKADYAIVLGAGIREDGQASRIMRQRLRASMEFMQRNPSGMVILSGGQGDYEPIPEAQCMYTTLLEMGADPARLLTESESATTRENLLNSMEIIRQRGGTKRPVALITSEFHSRRAGYIADNLGIATCPVPARTDQWFYRVNYTLREVFAFVKAFVQGGVD